MQVSLMITDFKKGGKHFFLSAIMMLAKEKYFHEALVGFHGCILWCVQLLSLTIKEITQLRGGMRGDSVLQGNVGFVPSSHLLKCS